MVLMGSRNRCGPHDVPMSIPYKRIGEPDDLGRAAVWLVSDEAD